MNTIIEALNKCDIACCNGESLSWFYDEDENLIYFRNNDDECFSVLNDSNFLLDDNEIILTSCDNETFYIELYCIVKPTFNF